MPDQARVSPDGYWLAFNCNSSGRQEIYVVPFPDGGQRTLVSVSGGVQPAWRGDAKELYFLAPDGSVMAVAVTATPALQVGHPRLLFKSPVVPDAVSEQYRVTADGRRFLMLVPESSAPLFRVVVNWRERFKDAP